MNEGLLFKSYLNNLLAYDDCNKKWLNFGYFTKNKAKESRKL